MKLLQERGAKVDGFDPLFTQLELKAIGFFGEGKLEHLDGIIIHNGDLEFTEFDYSKLAKLRFIFDGRYILRNSGHGFSGPYLHP